MSACVLWNFKPESLIWSHETILWVIKHFLRTLPLFQTVGATITHLIWGRCLSQSKSCSFFNFSFSKLSVCLYVCIFQPEFRYRFYALADVSVGTFFVQFFFVSHDSGGESEFEVGFKKIKALLTHFQAPMLKFWKK